MTDTDTRVFKLHSIPESNQYKHCEKEMDSRSSGLPFIQMKDRARNFIEVSNKSTRLNLADNLPFLELRVHFTEKSQISHCISRQGMIQFIQDRQLFEKRIYLHRLVPMNKEMQGANTKEFTLDSLESSGKNHMRETVTANTFTGLIVPHATE